MQSPRARAPPTYPTTSQLCKKGKKWDRLYFNTNQSSCSLSATVFLPYPQLLPSPAPGPGPERVGLASARAVLLPSFLRIGLVRNVAFK